MLRKFVYATVILILGLVILSGCGGQGKEAPPTPTPQPTISQPSTPSQEPTASPRPKINMQVVREAMTKSGCGSCHVIPGIPKATGQLGPDLSHIATVAEQRIASPDYTGHAKTPVEYIRESIVNADVYVVPECPTGPCQPGQMPPTLVQMLSEQELDAIIQYLSTLR